MCGIVGAVGIEDRRHLDRMNEVQAHRGPDDAGEYWDAENRVGLAMRRLSIIDIEGGHQPMSDPDQSVWIVFNGEVYNAPELRKQLEEQGRRFRSDHSDTEVVLQLYLEHGDATASMLNGMFAFVIYDRRRRRIYAARDPFGIKPLYVHQFSSGIAWASELKSLQRLPSFSRDLDPLSVEQYLGLGFVPQQRSIFAAVNKLRPGFAFTYSLDERRLEFKRYYTHPLGGPVQNGRVSRQDLVEQVRSEFQSAVVRWSLSDVPIACSLSGGLDSAAIVAALARSGQTVRTYSLGFTGSDGRDFGELADARRVAEMYDTEHHEITLDVNSLIGALPEMVWHLDEPYGGGVPSWYVFREIARGAKVALTGTGGDELFSNYNLFNHIESLRLVDAVVSMQAHAPMASAALAGLFKRWYRFKSSLNSHEGDGVRVSKIRSDAWLYWKYPYGISAKTVNGLGFNERIAARSQGELSAGRLVLDDTFTKYPSLSLRDRCVAVQLDTQLPDEFLAMTDRFSMAHSLEARTPFLDKKFAAFVLGIDSQTRLTPGNPKSLFADAVKDWLPDGHTELRKKGFVIPVSRWLRGPLRDQARDLFQESALRRSGFVRPDFYKSHFKPFLEGEDEMAYTMWTVFMFRLWQEHACR